MEHSILIVKGDISNGKITLDPADTVEVNDGDLVEWSIAPGCAEVKSFRIKKKLLSKQIFASNNEPSSEYGTSASGAVSERSREYTYYKYSIKWKDHNNNKYKHDPIIAVKPTPLVDPVPSPRLLIGIVVGLLAVLTLQHLLSKKK